LAHKLELHQKVAIWALAQTGKKIGRGECWDFAEAALKQAGAQSSVDLGPVADDTDYVWGDPVALKDVIAGDFLQFRDFVVTTRTVTEMTFKDGSGDIETKEVTLERPHHTAIVAAVLGAGAFQIFEQNVQPQGKVVQRQRLQTSNTLPISTRSHKAVKDASGKFVQAEVVSTVSVSVAGQVWAYRAKPRGP